MNKLIKILLKNSLISHISALRGSLRLCITVIIIGITSSAQAAPSTQVTEFSGGENGVVLSKLPSNFKSIRVTGPDGFVFEGTDNYVQALRGEWMPDGQYSYELRGKVSIAEKLNKHSLSQRKALLKNNEEQEDLQIDSLGRTGMQVQARSQWATKVLTSGYFRIEGGQVMEESTAIRESDYPQDHRKKAMAKSKKEVY